MLVGLCTYLPHHQHIIREGLRGRVGRTNNLTSRGRNCLDSSFSSFLCHVRITFGSIFVNALHSKLIISEKIVFLFSVEAQLKICNGTKQAEPLTVISVLGLPTVGRPEIRRLKQKQRGNQKRCRSAADYKSAICKSTVSDNRKVMITTFTRQLFDCFLKKNNVSKKQRSQDSFENS